MPKHSRGVPSRFVEAIRSLDEVYFMREEVARMLGVSPTTLKAWGDADPELGPYAYAEIENRHIYLYRPEDVAALRAYQLAKYPLRDGVRVRRRGRPKLWSEQELVERDRRWRRVGYLKQRARKAAAAGAEHTVLDLLAEAELIRRQLKGEYAARFAEVTRPRPREADWLAAQMQFDSVS